MARELPDTLYSPEQLKSCLFEMERLVAWRRGQDIRAKSGVATQAAPDFDLSPQLSGLIGPMDVAATLAVAELDEWKDLMDAWLKQPVTHVTFAVAPPAATKLAMVRWFRAEIVPTALVKFEVNRNIVGGMVVRTSSKIFDFSFRRKLLGHKSRIAELLKHA